jgi:outer membrane protein insertion porin family
MFFVLCLALATLSQQLSPGTPLNSVDFKGNKGASQEELLKAIGTRPGATVDSTLARECVEKLLSFYRDRGYLFAEVSEAQERSDGSTRLVFTIVEGPRLTLGNVTFEGNESVAGDLLLKEMDTRAGRVFNESAFAKDMERILTLYENKGYAFAQVLPEAVFYDTLAAEIELKLRIVEGPLVRFSGARILGARATRQEYLSRESGIREGDLYSASKLENARRRLGKLPFILEVEQFRPVRGDTEDRVWAETTVREGKMSTLHGVLGVEPESGGDLTGLVDVDLANLAGSGRAIRARWQRTTPLTSSLFLAYREPFVFSYDFAVKASFDHQIRDTSFTKSTVVVDLQTRYMGTISLVWGISASRVLPGSAPTARSTSYGVGAGVLIDTRSFPEEPGLSYETRAEYAIRINSASTLVPRPEPRASTGRLLFDLLHHVPVPAGRELFLGVHGRETHTSEATVPLSDYFFLGGAGSVRGYREEQFTGWRVAWANLEYRLGLGRDAYFYPFVDLGYYQTEESAGVVGYGLGFNFRVKAGSLGLDYGLGEDDGPLDGKIHLRLAGEF